MEYIDLHLHSTYSDGTMTPAELVQEAVKQKIRAIAVTDHDTCQGTSEALVEGERLGVEVISGIEISAYLDDTPLHILGYGFDHKDPDLFKRLKNIQRHRDERNKNIATKLYAMGITITDEELLRHSPDGQTGRPHFAALLIEKKIIKTMNEAFDIYLGKDKLAYAPRKMLMVQEAISMIRNAHGIAVLAHPLSIDRTLELHPMVLAQLKEYGLGGVEVFYPTHSKKIRQKLTDISRNLGLLITGGSDFHGAIRNGTRLGGTNKQRVPYELFAEIKQHMNPQPSTLNSEL